MKKYSIMFQQKSTYKPLAGNHSDLIEGEFMLRALFTAVLSLATVSNAYAASCYDNAKAAAVSEIKTLLANNVQLQGTPVYLTDDSRAAGTFTFTADFDMVALYKIQVVTNERCEVVSVSH